MKRFREFIVHHWRSLIGLHDTPHSIAGGIALGIFFGFTPLFGFKTLLAMLLAWCFRCSYVAAVIAVNLHDVTLPLMPFLLRMEYGIGYFLLNNPHVWPPKINPKQLHFGTLVHWSWFINVGWPMLLGSVLVAGPVAIASFFAAVPLLQRYQAHREAVRKARETARLGGPRGRSE